MEPSPSTWRRAPIPARYARPLRPAAIAVVALLAACGGAPPESLGGFELDMTQAEVMQAAAAREGFTCRLRATRPKITICGGPTSEGRLRVLVEGDSAARISLQKDAPGDDSADGADAMQSFARRFGTPAWRDRPYPPQSDPPESFHTLWLDDDTTRAIALVCRGTGLEPPCSVELARTSPTRLLAQLDTLLGIRR